jgi:hypothetical protein
MDQLSVPSNFHSVIIDFTNDLSITFSEYSYLWKKWQDPNLSESDLIELFQFCVKVYPQHFFDILYQKEEIFSIVDNTEAEFLPNVNFKLLFSCENVSEKTRKIIWKYLQLILFTIVGGIKDKSSFGDAANMFEGIDENELHEKLNETMGSLTDFFKNMEKMMDSMNKNSESNPENVDSENMDEKFKSMFDDLPDLPDLPNNEDFKESFMDGIPNIEKIQEHLKTLFDGKIGKLAKEMAEEISGDFIDLLGKDGSDIKNPQDAIKQLMKNPKKLMELMKSVSGKLDSKMKSGEISKEELMKEASEMMEKMKEMGGKDQFNDLFKNLSKNMGMGKDSKIDKNAMERMSNSIKMKENMKNNLLKKKEQKILELERQKELAKIRLEEQQKLIAKFSLEAKDNDNKNLVFKLEGEESQEKSFIHPDLLKEIEEEDKKKQINSNSTNSNSNKKNKKKKNK